MEMWMKVGWALLLGAMVVILLPRAKRMLQESQGSTSDDWKHAAIAIAMVAIIVLLLISFVS